MKYVRFSLTVVLSILLFTSCGNNKKQGETVEETFDIDAYIKAAEAIEPKLNTVDQVFKILDMVNAEYYDALTNDPYSAHSYTWSYPIAAANLGVYMTDMTYHMYGEATEPFYLTFSAAQELARYIGIESNFASVAIDKLEGSIVNRDTISTMFNNLLVDSEKYNSEKEMIFVHTASLTGSFVEKVYISGSILKQKMYATELTKQDESDIRELLIIYLNQLNPSTGILYDAFERQKDQLEGIILLSTFQKLETLSDQLKLVKPTLVASPISEIASNKDLITTFDLITNLRNGLVAATR